MKEVLEKCCKILLGEKSCIAKKTRALFTLKNICTDRSAEIICNALLQDGSVLLKHEAAYVLGQMQLDAAKQTLVNVLHNIEEDVIVRHEAGEALGNFNDEKLLVEVERYIHDSLIPLRETCILASAKIRSGINRISEFDSYDPAEPFSTTMDINEVLDIYTSGDASIVDKYRALFYLRDLDTDQSIDLIARGFTDQSDLLKHEIAFVFGQMKNPHSLPYMISVLEDENEHPMVRHECAEAIGAIRDPKTADFLTKFAGHSIDIIRESAIVALDIHKHCMCKFEDEYVLS